MCSLCVKKTSDLLQNGGIGYVLSGIVESRSIHEYNAAIRFDVVGETDSVSCRFLPMSDADVLILCDELDKLAQKIQHAAAHQIDI